MLDTSVEIDLGAGTARTCSMLPEVIFLTEPYDTLCRNADLLIPDLICLIVFEVYGRIELLFRHLEHLRQELPCPRDDLLLEVISEREITDHLEVCSMSGSMTDVLDVRCPDTLLASRYSLARRSLGAREVRLHRGHARIDKQYRRVVLRHE